MVKTPTLLRWILRIVVVAYLVLLVAWPVSLVVRNTFADGFDALATAFSDDYVLHALKLTVVG